MGAEVLVYVGTYTHRGGEGIGIYAFDTESGTLQAVGSARSTNPSFLALDPEQRYLYATNELWQPEGTVSAFAVDAETGALTFLNEQPSHGASPCHVSVDATGDFVYVTNYSSGSVAVYPVQADGSLGPASDVVQHSGSGPDPKRQRGPHAHSITLDPSNRFAFVADLGLDRLMAYKLDLEGGKLVPNDTPWAAVAGGLGPRHFTFSPDGRHAYLINEMGNTIIVFAYDSATGVLTQLQSVPTLPKGFAGENTTADVHVHPSGRYLYGSNRGHDSLVIYGVDPETGLLSFIGHQPTGGKTPRNFGIDPTGRFLIAANQDSDNLVVFRIDLATGKLEPTGTEVKVSMPVCVRFVPR